jgi:hypothetical protein
MKIIEKIKSLFKREKEIKWIFFKNKLNFIGKTVYSLESSQGYIIRGMAHKPSNTIFINLSVIRNERELIDVITEEVLHLVLSEEINNSEKEDMVIRKLIEYTSPKPKSKGCANTIYYEPYVTLLSELFGGQMVS